MTNLERLDDRSIISMIAQDDEKALDELFKRYFYKLCHFVNPFVNLTNVTEEIVSDVFINIWLKRQNILINTNVKSYLFQCAKHAALNYLDKAKDGKRTRLLEMGEDFPASHSNADANICFSELQNQLNDLIHQLPDQQKMILRLNKIEGFSPKEIAELLSITQKTVYNNLYEAVRFLSMRYKKTIALSLSMLYIVQHLG